MLKDKKLKNYLNIEKQIRGKMMNEKKENKKVYYSTGSDLLDLTTGETQGIGFCGGSILNIIGDECSGKSFLCCEIIASSYYNNKEFDWNYDDCESGFTFNTKKLYGFNIVPEKTKNRIRSKTVQDLHGNVRLFLKKIKEGMKAIYICDSLDGLTSKEAKERIDRKIKNFEKDRNAKEEGTYGTEKPKYLSQQFLPDIADVIEDTNTLLAIVSQTRDKIGSMFKAKIRAGGKALNFYSHYILWMREVCKIEKKGRAIGVVIEIRFRKAKNDRPFRKCMLTIYFDYGIDNISSNIDYLFDLRTEKEGKLKDSAKSIQWNEEKNDITIRNVITFLRNKEEWYNKYTKDNPDKDLKGKDRLSVVIKWIEQNEEIKKYFDKEFGNTMSRNELIDWIEQDEERKKELTRRVREKWETIENLISTKRPKKYSKK
jgi:RecA/RadA recombinase